MRLRDALAGFLERKRGEVAHRTWIDYERIVRHHVSGRVADSLLSDVRPSDIDALLREPSKATARKLRTVLNQTFEDAVRGGTCNSNPVARSGARLGTPRPRLRSESVLSFDQVEALASSMPSEYGALVRFAAASGLRFGELAGLRPSDFDTEARTVTVERQWCGVTRRLVPPKSDASRRTAPYADSAGDLVLDLLNLRSARDHVFATPSGARLSNVNFNNRVWRPAVQRAGLNSYRFHDLRHTYASTLIRGGVNVALVSRVLGHSSPQVTLNVYAGVFEEDLGRARAVLDGAA